MWRKGDFNNNMTPEMVRISTLMKTKSSFGKQASVQLKNSPNVMPLNCKESKK